MNEEQLKRVFSALNYSVDACAELTSRSKATEETQDAIRAQLRNAIELRHAIVHDFRDLLNGERLTAYQRRAFASNGHVVVFTGIGNGDDKVQIEIFDHTGKLVADHSIKIRLDLNP